MSKILSKEEWIDNSKIKAGKKNAEIMYTLLIENDIETIIETALGDTPIVLMQSLNVLSTTRLLDKFNSNMKTTTAQFYIIMSISFCALIV